MKNSKIFLALFVVFCSLLLCTCGAPLTPVSGGGGANNGSSGEGGSQSIVPGSGGNTMADIIDTPLTQGAVGSTTKNGMRLFVMGAGYSPDDITTPGTLGIWKKDKKFHIAGMSTGGYMNAGFDDVSYLYYDRPFEADEGFKFSARVRIISVSSVSTGKGVHVGVYAPNYARSGLAPITDKTGVNQVFNKGTATGSKGMGIFLRAESVPQIRLYYSSADNSTTAGTAALPGVSPGKSIEPLMDFKVNKEYIYEVSRGYFPVVNENDKGQNESASFSGTEIKWAYGFKVLDSKTGLPAKKNIVPEIGNLGFLSTLEIVPDADVKTDANPEGTRLPYHPVGRGTIDMHSAVKGQVFAGVCVPGSTVEVSQIKVWHTGKKDVDWEDPYWSYATVQVENDVPKVDDKTGLVMPETPHGDEPDFQTDDTIAAYVPAASFAVDAGLPINRLEVDGISVNNFNGTLWWDDIITYANQTLPLTMTKDPTYAEDTILWEFFPIMATVNGQPYTELVDGVLTPTLVHPGVKLVGTDPATIPPEVTTGPTYRRVSMQFATSTTLLPVGQNIEVRYKIVGRDVALDVPTEDGIYSPEYSLLQTLPEFTLRIVINRPN